MAFAQTVRVGLDYYVLVRGRVRGERDVEDLKEIVGVDGDDDFIDEAVLNLWVFVQVVYLRDYTQSYAGGREARAPTESGEHVEEVVRGAVVAFRGDANAARDGARHEEKSSSPSRVLMALCTFQVPSTFGVMAVCHC